jgi:hypothetical protein
VPEEEVDMNPPGNDVHDVEVQNDWLMVDQFSVNEIGFELHEFTDDFRGFHADQLVVNVFYPQVIDFVKKYTGANRVVVFDHTIRRRMSKEQMEGNVQEKKSVVNRPAVLLVHSDYTPSSGSQRGRGITQRTTRIFQCFETIL